MDSIRRLYYFFAPYVDADERAVGVFFGGLSERSARITVRKQLNGLLQRNTAALNLWSEYRYKGYDYLRKNHRKELYRNLHKIVDDFEQFRVADSHTSEQAKARIHHAAPRATPEIQRAKLLDSLTRYFSPRRGVYEYRTSSSFGRLLRDPGVEKLVGDCNQIVTLYIYMYSRYFDVSDLRVRVLPEHVALHYKGVDIEATNGTFTNYEGREGERLLPIEEIVSINLLDTTDSYLKTHEVDPSDFLQASRFAYILSHERDIVTNNLDAAYGTVINALMKRGNYAKALTFAKQSKNQELLAVVGHNGSIYFTERHNFKQARRFAEYSLKRTELVKNSYHVEGVYLYKAGKYLDAAHAFEKYGDKQAVQNCYEALFFTEQKKLGSSMTTADLKAHKSIISRMEVYAKKSGNHKLIDHVGKLKRHI